ncbi:ROK family transcriptional regulator [Zobellella iuensis]|uniref:ROK family transcriptional regulator n=1 Tax=Zobellella iuensis TaxID=2803811 RepID=A0ABS1QSM7_9GAMM|nr:ROK family transcriptional regulator [Zobellella iuensis]MBL1377875.1 ROK family transcriptional regulator [Zobellella iuensis]
MTRGQIANVDLVKQVNSSAVYRLIDSQGPISRVKIAELSNLAPASVTKITRTLLEHGLIREMEHQASTGGRRAISLTTVTKDFHLISVKLGRGELSLSLYDLEGHPHGREIHVFPSQPQDALLTALCAYIGDFIARRAGKLNLIALSVIMPGLTDALRGQVIYHPSYPLAQVELAAILRRALGLPVFIGNDIRALALAEHYFGAARDCLDSVLVSVHHGVGAGIITEGRIFKSLGRDVAEIGHIRVDPLGDRCHCGNFGCLETMVADAALLRQAAKMLEQGYHSQLRPEQLTMTALCQAALAGDQLARNILERAAEHLGQALAIMVNLFNPQKLLLTGALCEAESIVFPLIGKAIEYQSLPSFHQGLPLVRAHFQDDQTIGGLALVKRALLEGELLQLIIEPKS